MRCEIWLAEHKIRRPFDLLEPSLADVDFFIYFLVSERRGTPASSPSHLDVETERRPDVWKKEENEKEESDDEPISVIVAEFKLFFECRRDIPNRRDGTRDGMTCREFDRHLFLFCLVLMSKLWDLTNLGDTRDGWCAATYRSCQETLGNGTLCDTPSSRLISSIYFPIWKNVFFNLKK